MTRQQPVATTYGLAQPCSDTEPEQVYVFDDTGQDDVREGRVTTNDQRPIRVEGWKGYGVPIKMWLTRGQARELAQALNLALADPPPPGAETYELSKPTVDDVCPIVPEGASDWEAQEVRIQWRNVFRAAHRLAQHAAAACHRPVDSHPGNGAVGAAADMQAAQRELAVRLQGIEHRQALEAKAAEGA